MGIQTPMAVAASPDDIPMYRLYNPNSGEHFYTGSLAERDSLLVEHWQPEGIGWYAPSVSSTPVYRLYNEHAGDHHYTMSMVERDHLIEAGWQYEGIGWYSDDAERIPLYRQYNPNAVSGAHNYTTSQQENNMLAGLGWREEGIAWYATREGADTAPLTIDDDPAYASIEALVNLRGTGTGYHAKVVISGGAVASFGIQFEEHISAAFPRITGNTAYMVENVMSHATDPGPIGKEYLYLKSAPLRRYSKIRLSWYQEDNTLRFYVDDEEIGRTTTTMQPPFIFAVEGSTAHDGDSIEAAFQNIRVKVGDSVPTYGTIGEWNDTNDYFGLNGELTGKGSIVLGATPFTTNAWRAAGANATISGVADIPGVDSNGQPWTWDTCFSAVEPRTGTTGNPLSGVVNIAQKREAFE